MAAAASIVVGTDGSTTAGAAVNAAVQLARINSATLHLVCAYSLAPPFGMVSEAYAHYRPDEDAQHCLEREAARIRDDGIAVETYAIPGRAADALIDVAETQSADMIVVGSKGMTGSRRYLLGSVPDQVSHHAQCNVLIVRTT